MVAEPARGAAPLPPRSLGRAPHCPSATRLLSSAGSQIRLRPAMRRIGQRHDRVGVRWIARERFERALLQLGVRAEQVAQPRPVGRIPGISGDIRRDALQPVGRKPRKHSDFLQSAPIVAQPEQQIGEEIMRGQGARVAPLGRRKRLERERRIAGELRLDAADEERLGCKRRLERAALSMRSNTDGPTGLPSPRGPADLGQIQRKFGGGVAFPAPGRGVGRAFASAATAEFLITWTARATPAARPTGGAAIVTCYRGSALSFLSPGGSLGFRSASCPLRGGP